MKSYESIRALSESAYQFTLKALESAPENGKYELEDGAFANVFSYTTNLRSDSKYEAHKKYIDVQLILSGTEIIAVESLDTMYTHACIKPYEFDAELYAGNDDGVDYVMNAGDFLILLPEDAHMPGVAVDEPTEVKKVVLKIPVKEA